MTNETQVQDEATNKKEHFNLSISLLVLLVVAGIVVFELLGADAVPVDSTTPNINELQARAIAETSCIKGGEALGQGTYNENSKTWWFDANLNATKEGCSPACVVSEATKTAEINWRCTGVVTPVPGDEDSQVVCTMDAKICPDGSSVGRVGPNCAFAPCPSESDDAGVTVGVVLKEPFFLNEEEFITPLEVVEDSRCPAGVECIWAGQVIVLITKESKKGESEQIRLKLDDSFSFAGKHITLVDVLPAPRTTGDISPEEYFFTFTIK